MRKLLSFVAIFCIAMCVKAQTPATLPYSCDFSDAAENANWVFKNITGQETASWWIYTHSSDPYLFCGVGQDDYFTENHPVAVSAERTFNSGDAVAIDLSFDLWVGGEEDYDFLLVFVVPADVTWEASTEFPDSFLNIEDYIVCFGECSNSENVFLHNRNERMATRVPGLTPNQNYKLVFVWRNDDSDGDGYAVRKIDNITITAAVTSYGILVGGVAVTSENYQNITSPEMTEGTVSYNPENNTLTLDGVVMSYDGIEIDGNSCSILLKGNNSVRHIVSYNPDVTIYSTDQGSLSARYIKAVEKSTLTIKDCSIDCNTETWGIFGYGQEHLVIDNATVTSIGTACAIGDFADITLNNCYIDTPSNGKVDVDPDGKGEVLDSKFICNEDGSIAKEVVIKTSKDGITSVAENNINIYPNPAKDFITLDLGNLTSSTDIYIYNSLGQTVREVKNAKNIVTINVKDFEKGVYYVKINNMSQKLVIE